MTDIRHANDRQAQARRTEERLTTLSSAVGSLDERTSLQLVEDALADGTSSIALLHSVEEGMRVVGERYESGDIFLAGLIMAGEIFRRAMTLTRPGLQEESTDHSGGGAGQHADRRILIGTVAGDIHDIGKNAACLTLGSFGFTVKDLGVDVSPQRFLEEAKTFSPHIIGLSGLLSMAFNSMRDTVSLLRDRADELDVCPAMIIGGGTIDEHVARHVGADGWTTDAMDGVRLCQHLLESRRQE